MLSNVLMKKLADADPKTKSIINAIYGASNLSSFFIKDLLDHQLIEHGTIQLNYEEFDLEEMINDTFRILTPQSVN